MAITRKPKSSSFIQENMNVEALINRGGSPARSTAGKVKDNHVSVVLRLPAEMLERIDAEVQSRPVKTPRHTWLLEAVHEKLSRKA